MAEERPSYLNDALSVRSGGLRLGCRGSGRWQLPAVELPMASCNDFYLRWRILARIRRFFRPTLRRPLRFFMKSHRPYVCRCCRAEHGSASE